MAEIAFENFALALEAVRGTPEAAPTVDIPYAGMLDFEQTIYRPDETRGHLAGLTRQAIVRRWASWSSEGGLDTGFFPILANMGLAAVTSPSTPGGATNSRLWTFNREMVSSNVKTATLWWGDPAALSLRSAFGLLQQIQITASAKGTDGTTLSFEGVAAVPAEVAAPVIPAAQVDGLVLPLDFQVWLDTTNPIGTTEITGRPVYAQHTIPTGLTEKFVPAGPTGSRTINRAGRVKTIPTTVVEMELVDNAQYALMAAGTPVKLRVRHNGELIEPGFYEYVQVDAYGILDFDSWDTFQESNRTIRLELAHQYEPSIGTDTRVLVQNDRNTLV